MLFLWYYWQCIIGSVLLAGKYSIFKIHIPVEYLILNNLIPKEII